MSGPGAPEGDEHGLIARYFRPLATAPGAFQLLDDAAAFSPPPGTDLVLTKDGIAEGHHFLSGEAAGVVARKALRVNLSDLAAKGATPDGYLVLLGLGPDWTEDWVRDFAEGLAADQEEYGISVYGGDTIRADTLLVSITAFGSVEKGGMVRRAGARPGDRVYVSGTIGDGALGLLVATDDPRISGLDDDKRAFLRARYRLPQPRVVLAPAVARFATAALDVSDGLVGDLDKLCAVSRVSARIQAGTVPLSVAAAAAVQDNPALLALCLTGGDDYEILCMVSPDNAAAFEAAAAEAGVPVRNIGEVVEGGERPVFLDTEGAPMQFGHRAFSHVGATYSGP
ncbi:thiamine-phosphate kinase [Microbaculum marinisediminis]|uniref:Thiamine-monophosphate kinase n=1 Tax=Microbaculum marinisediminis TaxID=2931392 RepID=A0AAW5QYA3_9HYPH|nr:thiamine-phosphate kinase [Microbaculum sp. A6E488]MCT8973041.1 thiamine-phosphate kinase [Microbaculum sp. A6E488]